MDYQVWKKEEFGDTYTKVDCGDLAAAKREIDKGVRGGQYPILTVEVPYELSIKTGEAGAEPPKKPKLPKGPETKVKEETAVETTEGETEPSEGP